MGTRTVAIPTPTRSLGRSVAEHSSRVAHPAPSAPSLTHLPFGTRRTSGPRRAALVERASRARRRSPHTHYPSVRKSPPDNLSTQRVAPLRSSHSRAIRHQGNAASRSFQGRRNDPSPLARTPTSASDTGPSELLEEWLPRGPERVTRTLSKT